MIKVTCMLKVSKQPFSFLFAHTGMSLLHTLQTHLIQWVLIN
jgi:hypothetical protein